MRRLLRAALVLVTSVAVGCGGGGETVLPGPMTDEQKRKSQEEDRKIADEESQGSVGKAKKKK